MRSCACWPDFGSWPFPEMCRFFNSGEWFATSSSSVSIHHHAGLFVISNNHQWLFDPPKSSTRPVIHTASAGFTARLSHASESIISKQRIGACHNIVQSFISLDIFHYVAGWRMV
jgi:hypothetical protein